MKTKLPLSELLQKTPKSDLEALLLEFAKNDKHIERMLRIRLSTDVSEVQRVKSEIREIINKCGDRYGFIDYRSSYVFERQMYDLIENVFSRFISEKNSKDAFEVICTFFFELGKIDIDDSNGTIGSLLTPVMEYFAKVVELMGEKEKYKVFDWLENHLEDEKLMDYIRDYIFVAYIDFFTDEKYLRKKIVFFDRCLEENYSSENFSDFVALYKLRKYAENRLACMEKLKCPEEETSAFCKKYEKIYELSSRLAEIYLSKNQYAEAIDVYLKIINDNEKYPGIVSACKKNLLCIYEKTNDIEKQKPLIKEFIFDRGDIDLKYYKEYKSFFSESEWKKEFDSLIKKSRSGSHVAQLLFEEKKIEELYDYICEWHKKENIFFSTTLSLFDKYRKYFEPDHSAEIVQIYAECLDKEMDRASARSTYANIAGKLKRLMQFNGGKEAALELKEKWFIKYKNRSAMKDELNKISELAN